MYRCFMQIIIESVENIFIIESFCLKHHTHVMEKILIGCLDIRVKHFHFRPVCLRFATGGGLDTYQARIRRHARNPPSCWELHWFIILPPPYNYPRHKD